MRKLPVLAIAITFACLLVAGLLWRRAFPIATLDFRVSRVEAQAQLAQKVEAMGHALGDYRRTISFGENTKAKNFLELEHRVSQLEAITRRGVNLWYWWARWFRPEQHEEFQAWLDPQGRFVGFSHTIKEECAAPSLDREQARAVAEDFLRRHVPHHPLASLHFVSDSNIKRPQRTDWNFQWERGDLRLGDAAYRIYVGVQGNAIGNYSESLDVPEWWTRRFAERRETNELCETIAQWALLPIGVGAFVLFVIYARRG